MDENSMSLKNSDDNSQYMYDGISVTGNKLSIGIMLHVVNG